MQSLMRYHNHRIYWTCLVAAAVGTFVVAQMMLIFYAPLLNGQASWVYEDPHVLASLLLPDTWIFDVPRRLHRLLPLTPAAQHFLSLVVHLLNAALLGVLVDRIHHRAKLTVLAVVIWLVHPLPLQAVAYMAALGEVLTGTAALLLAVLTIGRWRWWKAFVPLLGIGLALLIKPSAAPIVVIPLLVWLTGAAKISKDLWQTSLCVLSFVCFIVGVAWLQDHIIHTRASTMWQTFMSDAVLGARQVNAAAVLIGVGQFILPSHIAIQSDWAAYIPLGVFGMALVFGGVALSIFGILGSHSLGWAWFSWLIVLRILIPVQWPAWREPEYIYSYQWYPAMIGLELLVVAAIDWLLPEADRD